MSDRRCFLTKENREKGRIAASLLPKIAMYLNQMANYSMSVIIFEKYGWGSLSVSEKINYCHSLHEIGESEKAYALLCSLEKDYDHLAKLFLGKSIILRETDRDEEALVEATKAIDRNPKNNVYLYYYTRALIHMDLGFNEEAIADYLETIKHESEDTVISTWHELGETYSRLSKTEEAIETFKKTTESIEKAIPMYYFRFGIEYQRLGRLDEALEQMQLAHTLHQQLYAQPDQGFAEYFKRGRYSSAAFHNFTRQGEDRCAFLLDIGEIYRETEDYDQSIEILTKAANFYPESDMPLIERGLSYKEAGEYGKAIQDFLRAQEMDPTFLMPTYWIAGCYIALGQLDEALPCYNTLLEQEEDNINFLLERAFTYTELGEIEKAEADFTTTLSIDPTNNEALLGRSRVRKWLEKEADALKDLLEAREYNEDLENDSKFLYDVAILLKAMGYKEEAVKELSRAIELDSNNPFLLMLRTELYIDLEQLEAALDDCNRAFPWLEEPADGYWLRGLIHLKLENAVDAISDAEEYIKLRPTVASGYYNLGLALLIEDQLEEALVQFETSLAYDDPSADAYYHMAIIHEQLLNNEEAIENVLKWVMEIGKEWTLEEKIDFTLETNFTYDLIEDVIGQLKELYNESSMRLS